MGEKRHTFEEPKLLAGGHPMDLAVEDKAPPGQSDSDLVYIDEIHARAETMSPLLQELLNMRPPAHWGINE